MTESIKKRFRAYILISFLILTLTSLAVYLLSDLSGAVSFLAGGVLLLLLALITGETVEVIIRGTGKKKLTLMFLLKILIVGLVLAVLIHYKFPVIFTASGTGFVAFLLSIMLISHSQKEGD